MKSQNLTFPYHLISTKHPQSFLVPCVMRNKKILHFPALCFFYKSLHVSFAWNIQRATPHKSGFYLSDFNDFQLIKLFFDDNISHTALKFDHIYRGDTLIMLKLELVQQEKNPCLYFKRRRLTVLSVSCQLSVVLSPLSARRCISVQFQWLSFSPLGSVSSVKSQSHQTISKEQVAEKRRAVTWVSGTSDRGG